MPTLLRVARWLLSAGIVLYCAGLLALALLWAFGVRGFWPVELANIFTRYLCVPLLLLVPLAFWWRAWVVRAAVIIGVAVFVALFGPQFIPPNIAAAEPGDRPHIRVATFNLQSSRAAPQVATIIDAIRAQRADVVVLQDLSDIDAAAIRQQLARDYPYQELAPAPARTGIGMISRYPLEMQLRRGPAMQHALLRIGTQTVTLLNVSLSTPEIKMRYIRGLGWVNGLGGYHTSKRSRDIAQLLGTLDRVDGPVILAGDFNMSDREQDYTQFATRLHDAFRETNWGFGFTFPSNASLGDSSIALPLIRIDYVWTAGGASPTATRVECGGGSDHCMVIADIELADQRRQPTVSY
jgi:endonuclease/exonuclease/phosphatase (EEP) superfamily protein YafD